MMEDDTEEEMVYEVIFSHLIFLWKTFKIKIANIFHMVPWTDKIVNDADMKIYLLLFTIFLIAISIFVQFNKEFVKKILLSMHRFAKLIFYDHGIKEFVSTSFYDYAVFKEFREGIVGVYAMQGRRSTMEDKFNVLQNVDFGKTNKISFFGVYDGHGGEFSAEYVKEFLFTNTVKKIKNVLHEHESFSKSENILKKDTSEHKTTFSAEITENFSETILYSSNPENTETLKSGIRSFENNNNLKNSSCSEKEYVSENHNFSTIVSVPNDSIVLMKNVLEATLKEGNSKKINRNSDKLKENVDKLNENEEENKKNFEELVGSKLAGSNENKCDGNFESQCSDNLKEKYDCKLDNEEGTNLKNSDTFYSKDSQINSDSSYSKDKLKDDDCSSMKDDIYSISSRKKKENQTKNGHQTTLKVSTPSKCPTPEPVKNESISFIDMNSNLNYSKLLTDQIIEIDKKVVGFCKKNRDLSGTTAVVAILNGDILIVGNVGDSRAVMGDLKGSTIQLSFDHKPNQLKENRRITEAGGFITFAGVWRVAGILATSRALGDFLLKDPRKLVTAEPDVLTFDLKEHKAHFVILATDGLWDVVSNEESVQFIRDHIQEPDFGARSLATFAYESGSQDNITVMVINFSSL